jgi:hypothetical protein
MTWHVAAYGSTRFYLRPRVEDEWHYFLKRKPQTLLLFFDENCKELLILRQRQEGPMRDFKQKDD